MRRLCNSSSWAGGVWKRPGRQSPDGWSQAARRKPVTGPGASQLKTSARKPEALLLGRAGREAVGAVALTFRSLPNCEPQGTRKSPGVGGGASSGAC